jgi:hypothetical protein
MLPMAGTRWRVCGWLAALLGALTMSARLVCALSSTGLSAEAALCSMGVSEHPQRGVLFCLLSSVVLALAARFMRQLERPQSDSKHSHSALQVADSPRPAGHQQLREHKAALVPGVVASHTKEVVAASHAHPYGGQRQEQGADCGNQTTGGCEAVMCASTASNALSTASNQAAADECLATDLAAAAGAAICVVCLPGAVACTQLPATAASAAAVLAAAACSTNAQPAAWGVENTGQRQDAGASHDPGPLQATAPPVHQQLLQRSRMAPPPHVEYGTSTVCAAAPSATSRAPAPLQAGAAASAASASASRATRHSSSALYRSPMQHHLCSIKLPTSAASAVLGTNNTGAGEHTAQESSCSTWKGSPGPLAVFSRTDALVQ